MTFQVSDFNDLINLLKANPEWQSQLRNLLLSDDFLALPNIVRQLGERIVQLTLSMTERLAQSDLRFAEIERRLDRLQRDFSDLQEWRLESHYLKNGAVYFGRLLKRSRILPKEVLADHLNEVLDETEYKKAILIDVVVKGKLQTPQQSLQEIYLALEVSRTINPDDISRAWERARLISRAGTLTIPVVAGESIRDEVLPLAGDAKVVVHCGGQIYHWQEVLAQHSSLN